MKNEFRQFDNVNHRLVDDLRQELSGQSRLSVAAASFSLYAFEALKEELEQVEEMRFIFTSPTFNKSVETKEKREFYIPKLGRERTLYGSEFEIQLRNQLTQKAIARECADWIRSKVRFKTNVTPGDLQSFLNHSDGQDTFTYTPFKDFTTTELGMERGNSMFTLISGLPATRQTDQFLRAFDELWRDQNKLKDVTDTVIDNIEAVYRENAPDFLYFITLYNIFNEFLADLNEDYLPNEATGFRNSAIWGKLYNFQRDAALAIINKLEKYNGCILADSVGLGKTFTALAVIKYYENRNKNVLVLCPKKLQNNWATFKNPYTDNPIQADRLRYDILFHTDLSRDHGMSGGIDLSRINWGNFDLVVIDESHNFRNGGQATYDEETDTLKLNRYEYLMQRVIRAGVKTKVLMLSATPVNNRFVDLQNQLRLAYEGDTGNIDPLLDTTKGINAIFKEASRAYAAWTRLEPEQRTTQSLLDSLHFDFFHLLDAVTIARSRKHVTRYYDTASIGQFPRRLPPLSRRPQLTDLDQAINFTDIATRLNQLNLSIYTPSQYILDSRRDAYESKKGNKGVTLTGREKGLRKLMAINLLKRLESSVNSFRLTLSRITGYIGETLASIAAFIESHEAVELQVQEFADDLDLDDMEADALIGRRYKVALADMDYLSWQRDLQADLSLLQQLLADIAPITPAHDSKLQQLLSDLRHKLAHPINGTNRKVLVFTAFSDTADYLYENLAGPMLSAGVHTALITGSTDGRSTVRGLKADFNTVLTCFSPLSKNRDAMSTPASKADIDLLIATDCISEGQNLQDCDYLINYDIHWNPVRIIQRFGRIDRIGSRNEVIQLVNYWPDMELDDYIQLKGRVESRMKATVLTATGDDDLLSANEKGDLDYRRNQLQKLQKEVVDLEDMDTGISIMDLGLNEFRSDLLAYVKEHPDLDHVPFGMSAVVGQDALLQPGVVFVLKNRNNAVNIDRKNQLHPFYMVYLSDEGEVLCDHLSPKRMLDLMRHACLGHTAPDTTLCRQFNRATRDGRDMRHYSSLLHRAIESIITLKQERDIDSLFTPGPTTALQGEIKGLDDFELISFLVVK